MNRRFTVETYIDNDLKNGKLIHQNRKKNNVLSSWGLKLDFKKIVQKRKKNSFLRGNVKGG